MTAFHWLLIAGAVVLLLGALVLLTPPLILLYVVSFFY